MSFGVNPCHLGLCKHTSLAEEGASAIENLLFCSFVRRVLVAGIGCAIQSRHSLVLPYNATAHFQASS